MVAKKRHPGKRLQLFQLSRSRGQHFLAHPSAPGGSGQRQTEGATGGQGRHLPSWGLFHTGEDTWRAGTGWAVASNPAPMGGSRKTLSCRTNKREPSRSGFSDFLLFCSAAWSQHWPDCPGWRTCHPSSGLLVLHPWPSS